MTDVLEPTAPAAELPNTLRAAALLDTAATLQHAIELVLACPELTPAEAKRIAGDVRIFCGWLHRRPDEVPLRVKDLRNRLRALNGPAVGLSQSRFKNISTSLRKTLDIAETGGLRRSRRTVEALSQPWRDLYRRVSDPQLRLSLSALFRWADAQGLSPAQLDNEVVALWREDRAQDPRTLAKDPDKAVKNAVYAWNRCARTVHDWPSGELTLERRRPRVTLDLAAFPQSFQDDVRAFARTHTAAAPAKARAGERDGGSAPLPHGRYRDVLTTEPEGPKPLAARTMRERLHQILLLASTLVTEGELMLEDVTSIAAILSSDNIALTLEALEDRNQTVTEYSLTVLKGLQNTGERLVGFEWSDRERHDLNRIRTEIITCGNIRRDEMTWRNRQRLAQFDVPGNLSKLVSLPDALMARAEAERARLGRAGQPVPHDLALDAMAATAIMILTTLPVRRRTLAETEIDANILWPAGTRGSAALRWDGPSVKTRKAIGAGLSPDKVKLLRTYLKHYRPVLAAPGNRYLFPSARGPEHMSLGNLARVVCGRIREHTGLEVNLHLFRHILATFLWRRTHDSRQVSRLLGHAAGSRSSAVYAEILAAEAAAELDQGLAKLRALGRRTHRPRGRR